MMVKGQPCKDMESVHAEGLESTKALSGSSSGVMSERENCGKSGKIRSLNLSQVQ